MTLGTYLRDARLKMNPPLSLRELARRLKISAPYVSDVELDRRNPRGALLTMWVTHVEANDVEAQRLTRRVPKDIADWLVAEPGRIDTVRNLMKQPKPRTK